ncbi:MAG: hypothetical protein H0U19_07135 [Acidobacteria bacterium]|nr:hypothetical protein [Acidobacteriota bacterium]
MIDGTLIIDDGAGERTVSLASYLDPAAEEGAHRAAYAWIKGLRHAQVDGRPFRQRFTVRGDSLWWFSEIYLHKERAVLDMHRAVAAADALIARERPHEIRVQTGSAAVRHIVWQLAAAHNIRTAGHGVSRREWMWRLTRLDWRACALTFSAFASRLRQGVRATGGSRRSGGGPPRVAAFIHRAFWRSGGDDGSAESYIGPVLKALEDAWGKDAVRYIGVGPSLNFRTRTLWHTVRAGDVTASVVPVEAYASWASMRHSRNTWRCRRESFRLLSASEDLRAAAMIGGVDCWPIVREQLAGIAWLQWPWSVRAMDEAAAALDAVQPASVLTYAEAGGWGRALMLEARRRAIPSAGLQHGFIYRHWLNYLHEPDEMAPAGDGDAGFPAPTLTLLFDGYAARHLLECGRFAPGQLQVTGSPRLDALMETLAAFTPDVLEEARRDAGVTRGDALVLVTTKEREARLALPAFLSAAEAIPGVTVVIKAHPAETPAAYAGMVAGRPNVRVVPASVPLATLLAASRAVITVNSTVALDAAVAGIPALVIGLPNNLSPFVKAGVLAGAAEPQMGIVLRRILYDEGFRQQLSDARSTFLHEHAIGSAGTAAVRSAQAIRELIPHQPGKGD